MEIGFAIVIPIPIPIPIPIEDTSKCSLVVVVVALATSSAISNAIGNGNGISSLLFWPRLPAALFGCVELSSALAGRPNVCVLAFEG